jgi:uncharacterized membrane protein YidH (DUF202 family)
MEIMRMTSQEIKPEPIGNLSNHLANERTFLAWIRTSIGVMAFGFVVVKFTLFTREISVVLKKSYPVSSHGYSTSIGVFLVAFGVLIGLMAFLRYKHIDRQIRDESYHPSILLTSLLTISILLIGILLVVYLTQNI